MDYEYDRWRCVYRQLYRAHLHDVSDYGRGAYSARASSRVAQSLRWLRELLLREGGFGIADLERLESDVAIEVENDFARIDGCFPGEWSAVHLGDGTGVASLNVFRHGLAGATVSTPKRV